jgi:hypothetical protein
MAYSFDPTSGDTRANLAERVIFNSFSSTAYAELVKRWLNDAVIEVCRRIGFLEAYEVQAFNSSGVVTQGTNPWFRIDEVWFASATATSVGEKNFMAATQYELLKADDHVLGQIGSTGGPEFYIARRATSPTGFRPQLDLRILPPGTGGYVAIKGEQTPAVMDGDSDTTGLGAEFDRAVVAWAKAQCFDNEDDPQMADSWMVRFEAAVRAAAMGDDGDDDSPDTVDGMWDC